MIGVASVFRMSLVLGAARRDSFVGLVLMVTDFIDQRYLEGVGDSRFSSDFVWCIRSISQCAYGLDLQPCRSPFGRH